MLQPSHHGGHQLLQLLGPLPARLQDLLVVGPLLAVVVHHRPVADQRQGEAAHPGVAGDDDLVDGAHPCSRDIEEVSYTANMHDTQMLGRYRNISTIREFVYDKVAITLISLDVFQQE